MNYDEDDVLCDSIVGRSYYFTKSIIIRMGDYTKSRLSGFPPNLTAQWYSIRPKCAIFPPIIRSEVKLE